MARSIHDTHEAIVDAWMKAKASGSERDLARVVRIHEDIAIQRSIKRRLAQQRDSVDAPPCNPDEVRITLVGDDYHAVTTEDLRATMHDLPPGRLDGLGAIELVDSPRPLDELVPGVRQCNRRGHYSESGRSVRLYGFRCDAELAPGIVHYLRLRTLATFVHELAHHFDFMYRTVGDRWRMDDREKVEDFARGTAYDHVATYVVPYLAQRYPDDDRALSACIEAHAGVALSLELLTDDRTEQSSMIDSAFRGLLLGTPDALGALALGLYFTGCNELASPIVDRVLAGDPDSELCRYLRDDLDRS